MKYLQTITLVTTLTFASMAASGVALAQENDPAEMIGKLLGFRIVCELPEFDSMALGYLGKSFTFGKGTAYENQFIKDVQESHALTLATVPYYSEDVLEELCIVVRSSAETLGLVK